MPIYLDDQAVELPGESLQAILQAAQHQLSRKGRVVVEVQWNGRTLVGEELDQYADKPVAEADLTLLSADPALLAIETLKQVKEQLDRTRFAQKQACEAFQADRVSEGMRSLGQAMEIWHQLPAALVHSAQLLGVPLNQVDANLTDAEALTQELIGQLNQLKDQVQAGDTIALADAMGYEWKQITHRWEKLVDSLLAHISPPPPSPTASK